MKKKAILALAFIGIIISSCANKETPKSLAEQTTLLRDSVSNLFGQYLVTHDASLLQQASDINMQILELDTTVHGQLISYQIQTQIYSLQGKKKEAFIIQGKLLPTENSLERLVYNGVHHKLKQESDSSNYYFALALNECNKRLESNPKDLDALINKIGLFIYQQEKDKAQNEIEAALKNAPQEPLLLDLQNNLDKMLQETQDFFNEVKL